MNQSLSIHENWSLTRKISFRFISVFFLLYIFPFPLDQIPELGDEISQAYFDFWSFLNSWGAEAFFGMDAFPQGSPGSGDRSAGWIRFFLTILIALLAGTVWSILDRKRRSYARLWRWFHLLIVFNLSYWLLVYGFYKAVGEQFGSIGIARMLETYGESSPMRILWTFMSVSEPYEQFSGWSEVIAGILLLFRRTRTLGALAGAGVMLNVFTLNMTYDVPVKIFSCRLMLQSIYIALSDKERLLALFIRNKPVPALNWPPFFSTPWKNYTLLGVQILLMSYVVYDRVKESAIYEIDPNRPKPTLYGLYDVEEFVINGDTLPPLTTDTLRWSKAFVDYPGFNGQQLFGIKDMRNNLRYLPAEIDSTAQKLILTPFGDTVNVYTFNYQWIGKDLLLSGVFEGDTLQIRTKFFDPDNFIVKSRGFHWISELPYNRRVPYR